MEVQNASLKAEVARLDAEKRRLTSILAQHEPNCAKRRRMCSGGEERTTATGQEEQYDLANTFRRPAVPGATPAGGYPMGQEQNYMGYSTHQHGVITCEEEEEETEEVSFEEVFKSEAKDYKYSGGEVYDVYNMMRQQPQLPDYSSSRPYAGGYYDHMCLAL